MRTRTVAWISTAAVAAAVAGSAVGDNPADSAADPVAVFPSPGSHFASPRTQISFRGAAPGALGSVSVVGSRTGPHSGALRPHSDGNGASFVPSGRFARGERVTVRADALPGGTATFTIATPGRRHVHFEGDPGGDPRGAQHFRSEPGLSPPTLRVTRNSPGTAPGDLFTAVKAGPGQDGPMITDGAGRLIWFRRLRGRSAFDFRVQTYQSRPVLTWWEGRVFSGEGRGSGLIYDSSYRRVAKVSAGNGYSADLHEFQLAPNGTAYLLAVQPVRLGRRVVLDDVVQEVDIATGLVVFEWHSLDHVSTSESYERPGSDAFDYFHANSVDPEPDGDILVSARNTHAAYEIDHVTGAVRWRLGGKRSSFRMGPGAQFVAQHDIRWTPSGTITVFDNAAPPVTRAHSRGLELQVDTRAMTAQLAHAYSHARPPIRTQSQGSARVLPNGNVLVGWGGEAPYLTEYDRQGHLLFDAHFVPDDDTYRAYRLPWSATPAYPPRAAALRVRSGMRVYASWNGATEVASWQVLAGSSPGDLKPVATAPRTGFETAISVSSLTPWVAVRALDASGGALATSRPIRSRG